MRTIRLNVNTAASYGLVDSAALYASFGGRMPKHVDITFGGEMPAMTSLHSAPLTGTHGPNLRSLLYFDFGSWLWANRRRGHPFLPRPVSSRYAMRIIGHALHVRRTVSWAAQVHPEHAIAYKAWRAREAGRRILEQA